MDLTSQVAGAINAWLDGFVRELLAPALGAAGELIFQTPRFEAVPAVARNWELLRSVTDALLVLVVLGAGVLAMTGGTDARYSAKVLIPRLLLGALVANVSLAVCGALIQLNNAVVAGMLGPQPGATVIARFAGIVAGAAAPNQVMGIVVGLAAAALALLLVALFIGRDLVLMVLVIVSPLALVTYAIPQLAEIAQLWWRAFGALLFVQVLQATLVLLGLELLSSADWFGAPLSGFVASVLVVSVLYLLFKLPFAAYGWAFHRSLGDNVVVRTLVGGARAVVAHS